MGAIYEGQPLQSLQSSFVISDDETSDFLLRPLNALVAEVVSRLPSSI